MSTVTIISLVCLAIGVVLLGYQVTSYRGLEITNGRVVGMVPHSSSKGTTYALIVAYDDRDHAPHRFTTSWSSSPPAHPLHAVVRVAWGAGGSADPCLFSFGACFGFAWCLIGMAALGLWISGGFLAGSSWMLAHFPNTY